MRNKAVRFSSLTACFFLSAIFAFSQEPLDVTNRLEKEIISTKSISKVSGEELLKRSNINPEGALFGKLNGLTVLQRGYYGTYGDPSPMFYVRGMGTFNNNKVLVIVDGLERDLSALVVEDIERVSVLKDAAALSKYGVRGSNGVIEVVTKRSETGALKINFSYQHSFLFPRRLPKFVDASTHAMAVNEGRQNDGLDDLYSSLEIKAYQDGNYPDLYPNVDWIKETYRDFGERDQVNLSVQGGSDKIRFNSLLNYSSDRGLLKNLNINPYSTQFSSEILSVRTNLDIVLTRSTQMKINVYGRACEQRRPAKVTEYDLYKILYALPANAFPIKTNDDVWGGGASYPRNPIAECNATGYATSHQRTTYADIILNQKMDFLLKGLSIESRVSFDVFSDIFDYKGKDYLYESNIAQMGDDGIPGNLIKTQYGKNEKELKSWSLLNGQKRTTNFHVGLKYQNNNLNNHFLSSLFYKQDEKVELGQFKSYMHQDFVLQSYYALNQKYISDFTVTLSGTSRLPKGNRWGFFPAVSFAWLLHKEAFMSNAFWANSIKLRASTGLTGNDHVSNNLNYHVFQRGWKTHLFHNDFKKFWGPYEDRLASSRIAFEKTWKNNIGIDAVLFDKFAFTFDAFYDKTYDILTGTDGVKSKMLGVSGSYEPEGVVTNYGLESTLTLSNKKNHFSYSFEGQIAYAKNRIKNMNEEVRPYDYLKRTGLSVGQCFGLQSIGFFGSEDEIKNHPTQLFSQVRPGDIKYKDQNSDNRINEYDEIAIGYSNLCPEIYFSFSIDLEYKGVGLSALFQGVGRYSALLNTPSVYFPLINNWTVSENYYQNRWSSLNSDNSNARYPRLSIDEWKNNYRNNSLFIEDASYLKLRSAEIYYKFKNPFFSKKDQGYLKFFVRGMDLFSYDKIKIVDPEDINAVYPMFSSYHFGIVANF